MQALWTLINSPAGITLIASVVLYLLNRLYAAKPLWQQYEGTIVSAIRTAEKLVPDSTPNRGLAKFDAALKFVLQVFEARAGRKPTPAEEVALREGIQIKHNQLDAAGQMKVSQSQPTMELDAEQLGREYAWSK